MRLSFTVIFLGCWVTGQRWMSRGQDFPKPSISVSPSDMVRLRGNVNIQCRNEKVAGVEFVLLQEGHVRLFRNAELHESVFSLTSVKKTDSGVYWCKYHIRNDPVVRWSPDSHPVHINVIDPSLTKPSIKVSPKGKLALGSNVTIECQSNGKGLNFSLRQSGHLIASQKTEPHGNTSKFLLSMGRTEDAGSYICQYQQRENPFVWSEPSDPVELVVTDPSLFKPSIKVRPEGLHEVGANVTIECKGPKDGLTFSLHKSKNLSALRIMKAEDDTAKFSLSPLRREDEGNYTCQYYRRGNLFVHSEPSDPAGVVVTVTSLTEIIIRLGVAGFILLALGLIVAEAAYRWRKGEL